jgi:hypothetical protein
MAWNNPYLTNAYNPALTGYQPPYPQPAAPQMQVVRVKGRPGADAYVMGPNCSALLLDESGTLVWLCVTDGAGYKTISPYDITPHQDAPAPDYGSLESRISKLEEIMYELSGDTPAAGRGQSPAAAGQKHDGNAQRGQ